MNKTFEVKNIINVIFFYFMILQEKLGIENFSEIENLYRKIFKRSNEKKLYKETL